MADGSTSTMCFRGGKLCHRSARSNSVVVAIGYDGEMRRPRGHILAAICAVLLLATLGLWVRSQYRYDYIEVQPSGRIILVDLADGELEVCYALDASAREVGRVKHQSRE